jgi:hypothetical protein
MAGFTLDSRRRPSIQSLGARAMQIVNGYVCMNCCDVDKARLGQDPHQSADQLKKQIEQRIDPSVSGKFGPAVTFGGALSNDGGSTGVGGADASSPATLSGNGALPSATLDIFA